LGPLKGIKVIEIASIGPGPFCAMMLSDMGAEVLRIERPNPRGKESNYEVLNRGRRKVSVDLKTEVGLELVLRLIGQSDALIEGFRPGVMERLGLGPDKCFERNQRLIYGRVTGWGQTGPLSHAAGHDINYIALSGALHSIGQAGEKPVPPLNLVGDFGGGGMLLAFGIVCGILEARESGRGQVIDAAMTDGATLQMAMIYGLKAAGKWRNQRGTNLFDGGAPFYSTYKCADGKYVAIGSLESKFLAVLLEKAGLSDPDYHSQQSEGKWLELERKLTAVFLTRTRDEWCEIIEGTDACFAPVLDLDEAPRHPHNVARKSFIEVDHVSQPAPAPRFSRTKPEVQSFRSDATKTLLQWGLGPTDVSKAKTEGSFIGKHDEDF
jgi:alpha-methylacyl-CoA racemase